MGLYAHDDKLESPADSAAAKSCDKTALKKKKATDVKWIPLNNLLKVVDEEEIGFEVCKGLCWELF